LSGVDIRNARDPEQARRMKALSEAGLCYFCKQGSVEDRTLPTSIREGKYWYVMRNDFPLDGSVHHYMIVPHRHVVDVHRLTPEERVEVFDLASWLVEKLEVTGYSMFVRSGDTTLTGGTISHSHYHFLVGGPRPEGPPDLNNVVPVVIAFKAR
jgi:diadenosine tetraphosphate (Ap4A) HIT family hydrolase